MIIDSLGTISKVESRTIKIKTSKKLEEGLVVAIK